MKNMADKNIQMTQRNATNDAWDNLYPITKEDNVLDSAGKSHMANYIRQPGYAAATGSANTYAVTLNPAPSSYVEGMAVAVKINVNNTGASTININGFGAKSIKKPNGNDVSAGNLKAGSIYTLRYNGTNFILQGSDAAGNATPADVLSGKTFSNDNGPGQTGTMPIRAGDTAALSSVVNGNTLKLLASNGYRDGVDDYVTILDNDWIEANIKQGVNIFGKVGTLIPLTTEKKFASGTVTSTSTRSLIYDGRNNPFNYCSCIVSGLNFKPKIILVTRNDSSNRAYNETFVYFDPSIQMLFNYSGDWPCCALIIEGNNSPSAIWVQYAGQLSVSSTGFTAPVFNASLVYNWYAWDL